MKTTLKRNLTAATVLLAMAWGGAAAAQPLSEKPAHRFADPLLRREPNRHRHGLFVDVWTDVGEGGVARRGESVRVYFRVNRDAYVTVYDIDTRGRRTRLFPRRGDGDGYVPGGRSVALPDPYDDYRLVVTGPRGTERIVAVASDRPRIGRRDVFRGDRPGSFRVGTNGLRPVLVEDGPLRLRRVPRSSRRAIDETWFRVRGWRY